MGAGGFTHGFTYSHAPAGAAVALEVLRILEDEDLVEASAVEGGAARRSSSRRGWASTPASARSAAAGLLVGIELVEDRATRAPVPRAARLTEAVVRAARERGVLVYSGTGSRTASTATRSCSVRRSSSPTTSWPGSPSLVGDAIEEAYGRVVEPSESEATAPA